MLRNVTISPCRSELGELVRREFPTLSFNHISARRAEFRVSVRDWRSSGFDITEFDAAIDALEGSSVGSIAITEEDPQTPAAVEILTRAQRSIARRNPYSATEAFDEVLERHRDLHDLDRATLRYAYNHAVDTWQWILRLREGASLELQIAALFSDAERLISPRAPADESLLMRDAQARAAAEITRRALAATTLEGGTLEAAADLVASHQRDSGCPNAALLNDAGSLSFFSLGSGAFLEDHGWDRTLVEARHRLHRMTPDARTQLRIIRLPADVASMIAGA